MFLLRTASDLVSGYCVFVVAAAVPVAAAISVAIQSAWSRSPFVVARVAVPAVAADDYDDDDDDDLLSTTWADP